MKRNKYQRPVIDLGAERLKTSAMIASIAGADQIGRASCRERVYGLV